MSAYVTVGALENWLSRQSDFPADCARPFAALLAHYGRRLDRPPYEEALRSALIKYLDRAEALRDEEEFDLIPDQAALLLDCIEDARGGKWPIEAPGEGHEANHPPAWQGSTIQVERGLGKQSGRGLTDDSVLFLLAVSIVATETSSIAAAIRIVLEVFPALGLPSPGHRASAEAIVSRTRKLLVDLLTESGAAELTPAGVRTAYAQRARELEDDAMVCIPREPDGVP